MSAIGPYAIFMGMLIGLGQMSASSELVVYRTIGVSKLTLVCIVGGVGTVMLLALLIVCEIVAGLKFQQEYFEPKKQVSSWRLVDRELTWIDNSDQGGIWLKLALNESGQVQTVTRAQVSPMANGESGLSLTSVKQADISGDITHTELPDRSVPLTNANLAPLSLSAREAAALSYGVLLTLYFEGNLSQKGEITLASEIHRRWTQPITTFALAIIALTTVLGSARFSSLGARVGFGLLVGIGFFNFQELLIPLSVVFDVNPLIPVLSPVLLLSVVSTLLLRRID